MNSFDMRRYDMLVRVREFGNSHADLFPPTSVAGQAFAEISSAIEGLKTHAAGHLSGRGSAREGTTSKTVAREALREDIDAIIRTARALALDTPGMAGKFRPPRGNGDLALLNTARAFARDAAPLKSQFIAFSMPEDFLEDLERDTTEFENASRSRDAGKDAHIAARAALDAEMEKALNALRRLEAAVTNRLNGEPAVLAVWNRARRIAPQPRARSSSEATTQADPAPLPEVSPAPGEPLKAA